MSSSASRRPARTATGAYTVSFPGLGSTGPGGDVQVAAFGVTANRCKVGSWNPNGTTVNVNVSCTDHAGAPADTLFVAQYFHGGGSLHEEAYLLADQPTISTYTPDSTFNFNSIGGPNTVTRRSQGKYTAALPGMFVTGGTVAVTAVGADGSYCKVASLARGSVDVACYSTAGVPADTAWTLHYTDQSVGNNGHPGGYALADSPQAGVYTPNLNSQWHSDGSQLTVTRSATGTYQVRIPDLASVDATSAMVTAVGADDSDHCVTNGWGASGTGTAVNVICHDAAGNLADAQFTLSYLTTF